MTLGKSAIWWFFAWPFVRRGIKKLWKRGHIRLAEDALITAIPEATPGTNEMVEWLAKKHKWVMK